MSLQVLASPAVYPLILTLTLLDGFLPVVPSESAVIAAGAFTVTGRSVLLAVVLAAAVGAFVGDHVAYAIGRLLPGRTGWVGRYLQRLADRAAGHLGRGAGVVVLTGRFIPCGRLAVTLACGAAGFPLRRFTAWTALATAVWATYTALLGYLGGAAFADTPWLGVAAGMVLGLVVSPVLAVVARRRPRPAGARAE